MRHRLIAVCFALASCSPAISPNEGAGKFQRSSGGGGSQSYRSNFNAYFNNLVFMNATNGISARRQRFLNNMDYLNDIWVVVGGQSFGASDTVTLTLNDGCGNLVAEAQQSFDNSGLTTPTSWKWVNVRFGSIPLAYGRYYELHAQVGLAQIVGNTDSYQFGQLLVDGGQVMFPQKKQDLMFLMAGTGDSAEDPYPNETTNIVCPSKCFLANPSGIENTAWLPSNQLNVLIRERDSTGKGSFWNDNNTVRGIATLKSEIANMLNGPSGLSQTYPFNNYPIGGDPAYRTSYYSQMNFYVAIEDPALDTFNDQPSRGFQYCANIDAIVDVVDGLPYGGAIGQSEGGVNRPAGPGSTGWGASMSSIMVHEVFGHGLSGLADEYYFTTPGAGDDVALASGVFGYQPNALPISSGCSEYCGGTQPVSWLVSQMSADRDADCWSKATEANCKSPGGAAQCHWIGNLPPIPYWGSYQCIPANAGLYNIGIDCSAHGNQTCYPLAPWGTSGAAIMDVVQPNGSIMESTHSRTAVPGFTNAVENTIKDELDCVFNPSPCATVQGSNPSRCTNLISRYGTAGSGYVSFLQSALACDASGYLHRR